MKRLIATSYIYTVTDQFGAERVERGSHLGRNVASLATLQRKCRPWERLGFRVSAIAITGFGESRWLSR